MAKNVDTLAQMAGLRFAEMVMTSTTDQAYRRLLDSMFKPEAEDEKYEIQERIGKGGFGEVYKILCKTSGELKAMKKLEFDVSKMDNSVLLREIVNILQIKSNENILQWFDIFRTRNNKLVIVMELCDTDLEGYWSRKEHRSLRNGFLVAIQAVRGVLFLHSHSPQIIHRDLKPQNMLIQKQGERIIVKISDFGLSSCHDYSEVLNCTAPEEITNSYRGYLLTTSGHGTKPFLAAEFFAFLDGVGVKHGKFAFDASLDIFALGQVLNYIFCYNDSDYGESLVFIDHSVTPH